MYGANKGADQVKLNCVFVFAYAKSRFSHDEAHIVKTGEIWVCIKMV